RSRRGHAAPQRRGRALHVLGGGRRRVPRRAGVPHRHGRRNVAHPGHLPPRRASGDRAAAAPLCPHRVVAERQILATEGSQRGGSIVTALLSCRWGARTYGAASYDEYGLFRLSEDEAQAWAARFFVADNAVLFMTGEPPEGFSLELPRGERHTLPAAE